MYGKKLVADYMNSLDQTKAFVANFKKVILILHEAWEYVKEVTTKICFKKIAIIPDPHGSYAEENLSSDPVLETYKNEFDQIMVEEDMIQTEEVIEDDDEIIALCQEEYAVEDVVLRAEDGQIEDTYNI